MSTSRGDTRIYNVRCHVCHFNYGLELDPRAYDAWRNGGALVQDAFPDLEAGDRELLRIGICSDCFDQLHEESPTTPEAF